MSEKTQHSVYDLFLMHVFRVIGIENETLVCIKHKLFPTFRRRDRRNEGRDKSYIRLCCFYNLDRQRADANE